MVVAGDQPVPEVAPDERLARLGEEFYEVKHTADPFGATLLGVAGFDGLVPDVSRDGSRAAAAKFAGLERRLAEIDPAGLNEADRIDHAVLGRLAWSMRADLEHALWETTPSASIGSAPQAIMFMAVPAMSLTGAPAVDAYLRRLTALPSFLDALLDRFRAAKADGRLPARVGVAQAVDQLTGHLGLSLEDDTLLGPRLPADVDAGRVRARAAEIVKESVRPALRRLLAGLEEELLPVARPDDRVGARFVPGGEEGYRAAVRRHTTTDLGPEEVHRIGLDCLAALRAEWAEAGGAALGTGDFDEIRARLREDRSLRFGTTAQIVDTVAGALRRAEEARDDWFPHYDIGDCVIEEINPIEAGNAALAYYRPPTADGSRPGAHCVLTADPRERFVYEYEALAFHESVPGHHLQIASAQKLAGIPRYRRFLDAEVCGYLEGWGLYSERLADEMGLYTSGLARLGMLSFDAIRACRLVVDTGLHHFGWSRRKAVEFMWDNTATTRANVRNEVDRYIAWPGQALAYMIGRREIDRLRALAETRLGPRFDIRAFHGVVLGSAAVPLDVLDAMVTTWADAFPG
ncbi:hypothetical protein Skr01_75060 [Sphaerisporangium krabiense]|nr:hypothetical protein Skr01_75060 [Sphaerisporangium krabiense]